MSASFVQAAPFLWLLLAVALEIGGTYLLKLSNGMTQRATGAGGIVLVMGAFAALAQAADLAGHVWQNFRLDDMVDGVIAGYRDALKTRLRPA